MAAVLLPSSRHRLNGSHHRPSLRVQSSAFVKGRHLNRAVGILSAMTPSPIIIHGDGDTTQKKKRILDDEAPTSVSTHGTATTQGTSAPSPPKVARTLAACSASGQSCSASSRAANPPAERRVSFAVPAPSPRVVPGEPPAPSAANLERLWSSLNSIFDEVDAAVMAKQRERQAVSTTSSSSSSSVSCSSAQFKPAARARAADGPLACAHVPPSPCGPCAQGLDTLGLDATGGGALGGLASFLDSESDGLSGRWDDIEAMEHERAVVAEAKEQQPPN